MEWDWGYAGTKWQEISSDCKGKSLISSVFRQDVGIWRLRNKSESHSAYHVGSTFTAENQLVLGELVTEEKSNEITAVPELLDSLNIIENSIVTADAMSCQKGIVGKMQEGKADYMISLKGNQSMGIEKAAFSM